MSRFIVLSILIILAIFASWSLAGIPKLINYQGMLTDSSGTPLTYKPNITFKIYDDSTAGNKKWEETQNDVQVINGLFNVILGSVTPIDTLNFNQQYWMDITVGAEHMPTRLKFTSVGYAYRAQNADTAEYARGGGGGSGSPWIFRISDGSDTTITTGGGWGVARFGNALFGNADSTHVNLGVACTTGTSGQNYKYCTVGGGYENTASGSIATVGGGANNTASSNIATVGGGLSNTASGMEATVGGGSNNTASGIDAATVGGGWNNTASGYAATVGGGSDNIASASGAAIGGGGSNTIAGDYSAIPGGSGDTLTSIADYSMAFGAYVYINSPYHVIFFDSTYDGCLQINRDHHDAAPSTFPIRVGTSPANGNGAFLTKGGVWTDVSSQSKKENFEELDGAGILDMIENMSVTRWNFKGTEERHIGPVAEDFYRAFGCGTGIPEDDSAYISAKDIAGVSLVAIQELSRMVKEQQKEIEALKEQIKTLQVR